MVERHLQDMILKHFDPKKADSIFTDEGEVGINQLFNFIDISQISALVAVRT
jgi:hypothetical protein